MYGIGRGKAIGHLLKGALPDPSWVPNDLALPGHGDTESAVTGGLMSWRGKVLVILHPILSLSICDGSRGRQPGSGWAIG